MDQHFQNAVSQFKNYYVNISKTKISFLFKFEISHSFPKYTAKLEIEANISSNFSFLRVQEFSGFCNSSFYDFAKRCSSCLQPKEQTIKYNWLGEKKNYI